MLKGKVYMEIKLISHWWFMSYNDAINAVCMIDLYKCYSNSILNNRRRPTGALSGMYSYYHKWIFLY